MTGERLPRDASFPVPRLQAWAGAVFERAGLDASSAAQAAAQLMLADTMGVRTHGLARLPAYWDQIRRGRINAAPEIAERWCGNVLVVEADGCLGQIAGPHALRTAMAALDASHPFVPFIIRNVGHLGALGTVLATAAEQGRVAFISQVTQPVMAPAGTARPVIGNNPVAFTAPRTNGPPLLFDFAASNVARGKIHAAALAGERIPHGWAIDGEGHGTEDPDAALRGSILPAAGHKGLALAMMVEVLAGALTGAQPRVSANGAPAGVGVFGFVCDGGAIAGDRFAAVMNAWTSDYEAGVGDHGRIPGSGAAAHRARVQREGLALSPGLIRRLADFGRDAGVPFPAAR